MQWAFGLSCEEGRDIDYKYDCAEEGGLDLFFSSKDEALSSEK